MAGRSQTHGGVIGRAGQNLRAATHHQVTEEGMERAAAMSERAEAAANRDL
jgi:hypothetical protein